MVSRYRSDCDFSDERSWEFCPLCGRDFSAVDPDRHQTREHVPPSVFLDDPVPEQRHTVGTCVECNNGHGADEAYVAALVECWIADSSDPARLHRPKIARLLARDKRLRQKIADELERHGDRPGLPGDQMRIARVLTKQAKTHIMRDLSLSVADLPPVELALGHRGSFDVSSELLDDQLLLPEVGSPALLSVFGIDVPGGSGYRGWNITQPGRYAYRIDPSDHRITFLVRWSDVIELRARFEDQPTLTFGGFTSGGIIL